MDRQLFTDRLQESAQRARAFAQTLVIEDLPETIQLRVRLNRSYTGVTLRADEFVFPDDNSHDRAADLRRCDVKTAVDALWREGMVPEWINVSAIDCDESVTLVELVCCGRFTADDSRLYQQNGPPPFAIIGVPLPPGQRRVESAPRWSIHLRSECWDRQDLANLQRTAALVWSLKLRTDEFDGDQLTGLPDLDAMEHFDQRPCSLSNPIAAVARFPRLRTARFVIGHGVPLRIDEATSAPGIETLAISLIPLGDWGFANLAAAVPDAKRVELVAAGPLTLDGHLDPTIESVKIECRHLRGHLRLPRELDSLSLRLHDGTDEDVIDLLGRVENVRALHLRGTAITDRLASSISEISGLEFLDIVDTGVSRETVLHIAERHPRLRMLPNYAQ